MEEQVKEVKVVRRTEDKDLLSCPECGKEMTARGLPGHLRFKHDMNADAVSEKKADSKNVSKAKQVFDLCDQLTSCRRRRVELKEMNEEAVFPILAIGQDRPVRSLLDALDVMEKEIASQLEALGYIPYAGSDDESK